MQNFFELETLTLFLKRILEYLKISWEVSLQTNTSTWTKYSPQSRDMRLFDN